MHILEVGMEVSLDCSGGEYNRDGDDAQAAGGGGWTKLDCCSEYNGDDGNAHSGWDRDETSDGECKRDRDDAQAAGEEGQREMRWW